MLVHLIIAAALLAPGTTLTAAAAPTASVVCGVAVVAGDLAPAPSRSAMRTHAAASSAALRLRRPLPSIAVRQSTQLRQ